MSDTTGSTAPTPHRGSAAVVIERSDDLAPPNEGVLRVLVAADDLVEREGFTRVLDNGRLEVAALAGSLAELLDTLQRDEPVDVCVVAFTTTTGRQPDAAVVAAIRAVHPEVGVVIVTRDVDPDLARAIADPATVGVGYLRRATLRRTRDLQRAVEDIGAGGAVLDRTIAAELVRFRHTEHRIDELTELDHAVAELMAVGATDQAIARQLGIPLTVVRNITRKLSRHLDVDGDPLVNRRVRTVVSWLRHRQRTVAD